MDPITTLIVSVTGNLSATLLKKIVSHSSETSVSKISIKSKIRKYFTRIANRVRFSVTYRNEKQKIEDAYSIPDIIDVALVSFHLDKADNLRVHHENQLSESLKEGRNDAFGADLPEQKEHVASQTQEERFRARMRNFRSATAGYSDNMISAFEGGVSFSEIREEKDEIIEEMRHRKQDQRLDFHRENALHDTFFRKYDINIFPASSLIKMEESFVVLGEAGEGKSALVAYVLWNKLQSKNAKFPFYFTSSDLSSLDLIDSITKVLVDIDLPDCYSYLDDDASNSIICVDGLDELGNTKFGRIVWEIKELSCQYPSLQFILAVRASAYNKEFSYMRELTLAPLSPSSSFDIVKKWHGDRQDSAEALLRKLQKNDRMLSLASRPLLLLLICNAHRRFLDISSRPAGVFSQCVDSLMWDWDSRRNVVRANAFSVLDLQKKVFLHMEIAYSMHENGDRYWDEKNFIKFLKLKLPRYSVPEKDSRMVLRQLCANHGLVIKFSEDVYGFSHLALQEYLAAEWLRQEGHWNEFFRSNKVFDVWWEHVTCLCMSGMTDASQAIEVVLNNRNASELHRLLIVGKVIKFDPIMDSNLRERIVRNVLRKYFNGPIDEANLALQVLVGWDDEWTSPSVREALGKTIPNKENWKAWLK